jgi:hypothetical protein
MTRRLYTLRLRRFYCYVMESGDGVVPELNDMAAMEEQQRQQQQ